MAVAIMGHAPGEAPFSSVPADSPSAELAFLIAEDQRWRPYLPGLPAHFGESLAQAVSACPDDLTRHTRRIQHAYRSLDTEALYGALLDLFTVLGSHGLALRRRMLCATRDRLSPAQSQAMSFWLETGRPPGGLPDSLHSRLSEGVAGETRLLRISEAPQAEERDPLLEAREFVEYSQLEQAVDLLERAVLADPGREALQEELLSLYRATGDHVRRDALHVRLQAITNRWSAGWAIENELGGGR